MTVDFEMGRNEDAYFMNQNQAKYDSWRSGIRDAAMLQGQIDALDSQLEALENAHKQAKIKANQSSMTARESFQQEVNEQVARNMGIEKSAQAKAAADLDGQADHDGGMSYGEGNNVSDGDQVRNAGVGTREQTGGVSGRTGGQGQRAVSHAAARVQRQNAAGDLRQQGLIREQSSKELGIASGTDSRKTLVLPEEYYDDALEDLARRIEEETGRKAVFTIGGIEIRGADGKPVTVRGVFSDKQIILQADHKIDPERLADHEIFHYNESELPGLTEYIRQQLSEEAFDRVFDRYLQELWPMYGCEETASVDEKEAAYKRIRQEVLADAYAGINAFGAGATRFTEDVKRITGEMGMGPGRQENGVRQTNGPLEERYSYAGEKAATADLDALDRAKQMQEAGVANETIRQQTGWFQGMDGKWRWEINDSSSRISGEISNYMKLKDLLLDSEILRQHPDLGEIDVTFHSMDSGYNGSYNHQFDSIDLNRKLMEYPEDIRSALLHEVQHAIQSREGFTKGASLGLWERKIRAGFDSRRGEDIRKMREIEQELRRLQEEEPEFYRDMLDLDAMAPDMPRGKVDWDTLEQIEEDPPEWQAYDARREAMEKKYGDTELWDFMDLLYKREQLNKRAGRTADELYWNTAGEIEARDVAGRRYLSAEQRKNTPPRLGDENTVFSDGGNVMSDYLAKADATPSELETGERLVDFINGVVSMVDMSARSLRKFRLGKISENHAALIESIMREKYPQFAADGYELWIDGTGVGHIENRHGENGRADHSMETEDAKKLIPWAAQNAESGSFVLNGKGELKLSDRFYNRDGSRAPEISLEKAIDSDTIYVSECVPDSKKKRIWITSAYIKKGSTGQELNMEDGSSPQPTPKAILDSNATTDIVANEAGRVKESFSVDDAAVDDSVEDVEAASEKPKFDRSKAPWKVRSGLKRIESGLLRNIQGALGAHRLVERPYLREAVQELADEYMNTGTVSKETMDRLFKDSYERGIIIDRELHDQYADVKKHLNTRAVTISEQDKADIADYNDFRRRTMGNLRIVNEGGLPVDTFYGELQSMAPGLFPEDITHPADQLVKMYEVAKSLQISERNLSEYYGSDADMYRRYARHDFETAVWESIGGLSEVRRYLDDRQAQKEAEEKAPATAEEAAELWKRIKEARKTYEKAMARSFLTEEDEIQVGRLLRGELQPEHLDPDAKGTRGILAVYEGKREYCRLMDLIGEYRRSVKGKLRKDADSYLETAAEWKDKAAGVAYSRETMERNIEDIVKDPKLAKKINAHFFEPIRDAEAAATRMKNDYRKRVRELGLSRKIDKKKGNIVSEAHAVQLYGEAIDNIRMLEATRGRVKNRDGKTLEEWRAVVDDLWHNNPGLDKAKIENAVQEFRKLYDELFQEMNKVRVRWGYEPVNYRNGYFPHFQPGDGDGILQRFGKALGIDTQVVALPTTINGLTHTFKPGIQWFGNAQERLGFNTAYDAVEGFDKYIEGIASVIHQTENIQKLRALASQVRYRTTEEGIQKQVDEIYADERLTEDEKQAKITQLYEKGKFSMANFVVELDEYTNLLANKKSKLDRTVEALIGRRFYTAMKWLEARVGANMIAGNLTSAFTNFIPLTQASAQIGYGHLLKGMWQTLAAYRSGDGVVGMSSFLTNRQGSDPLVQTWTQKASDVLGKPMELIDGFVSGSIVRAAYEQNLKRGMPESEAIHQADVFAARVMAERSKGGMPTLFSSSNPLFKLFTQFQLEVNNQFSEIFKDLPRAYRDKAVGALVLAFLRYFLGAWLFNELYEKLIGRRPALDPIDILVDLGGDLFGENAVGIGEAGANFATAILEELPFSSGLSLFGVELDGGRIPVSSAIPDVSALWDAATNTEWAPEKRWKEAKDELSKLVYVVPPFGGNQMQKIWKGVKAYIEGGSYSVDSAGNDILQYPVHNDENGDFWNLVRAMLMGKSSLEEAQDWVEDGFDSLTAKQTAVYQDMLDAGVSSRDAYALIDNLRRTEDKLGALQDADVPSEAKAVAFYGLLASDKERELMDALTDIGADSGEVANTLIDLQESDDLKGVEKYGVQADVLNKSALTEEEKHLVIGSWLGTEEVSEAGNLTQYGKFLAAMKAGITTDEYLQHRGQGGSVDDLLEFTERGLTPEAASKLSLALNSLEPEEGKSSVSQKQKMDLLLDYDMADAEKQAVVRSWLSDEEYTEAGNLSDLGRFNQLMASGVTVGEYIEHRVAGGSDTDLLKYVEAGLDADDASELSLALDALEPEAGKKQVADVQKWRVCVDFPGDEENHLTSLSAVMTDSQFEKAERAWKFGVKPELYVYYHELREKFDANGKGSYTQAEITATINAMGDELSKEQQAALWQIVTESTKAANNPYSTKVGQQVLDSKDE